MDIAPLGYQRRPSCSPRHVQSTSCPPSVSGAPVKAQRIDRSGADAAHLVTNLIISVDGGKAKGRCYLVCLFTALTPEGPAAVWEQGTYDNEFAKVDSKWRISLTRFEWNFSTPYEDGDGSVGL